MEKRRAALAALDNTPAEPAVTALATAPVTERVIPPQRDPAPEPEQAQEQEQEQPDTYAPVDPASQPNEPTEEEKARFLRALKIGGITGIVATIAAVIF